MRIFREIIERLKKKKRRKPKKPVIQVHHITYEPEWTVRVYVGEHWILTQLQRRKRISKGFIIALKHWLEEHEHEAKEI